MKSSMNIGLTYTGSEEKHQNYIRWLQQDKRVRVISLSVETKENKGDINDCDALVLSGGIDTHPGYYNSQQLVYPNMPKQFYEKRDAFEKSLFLSALKKGMPVLGICRGLQLVNCILGGNLQQDLAGKNAIHKAIVDETGKQFDKAHGVHIAAGSLLAEINGSERAVVNSAHHQCVQQLADELLATALSDDGVIEGLEWKDKKGKPFLLCVQWHPERMFEFRLDESPLAAGIREKFTAAIGILKKTA
jgi:putative glutamine amidotransferase